MYQIKIKKDFWETTTTYGDVMYEYEEKAQHQIEINKLNEAVFRLEKVRLIAIQALEAIKESGVVSIADQALAELNELKKRPNG